jgi:hypothetical protein
MINITDYPYNILITNLPGIGLYRFRMEQLQEIDLHSDVPHNDNLAGHMQSEFLITDQKQRRLFDSLIDPVIAEYDHNFSHKYDEIKHKLNADIPPPQINSLWVNRQKKYEFNPLHLHGGVYSFVLWYDIPYSTEEERIASPFKGNTNVPNHSGRFEYLPTDIHNTQINLPVDKEWNGTLAVFPAQTLHQVYPFYCTDKERITISGNYDWDYLNHQ